MQLIVIESLTRPESNNGIALPFMMIGAGNLRGSAPGKYVILG